MAAFKFGVRIPALPLAYESAALGASTGAPLVDADVGKVVKLAGSNNYVVAADGNDIEGILVAVEPNTVNSGWAFGTVYRRPMEFEAVNAGVAGIAVGALVVAAAQAAVGTANGTAGQASYQLPRVKAGTPANTSFNYRVKSLLSGTGAVGDVILVEKC